MIQVMEYLFVLSSVIIFTVLPIVQIKRKEYILDLQDKEAALTSSKYLTLFLFIEFFTLKSIPFLTKAAIMAMCYYDLDFEVLLNDR